MLEIVDSIAALEALRSNFKLDAIKPNKAQRLYTGFNTVARHQLSIRRLNGLAQSRQLECVLKPSAVAIVPLDVARNAVVIIEQFRIGSFVNNRLESFQLEIPAGLIDPGETPLEAAHRELLEETGLSTRSLTPALEFYSSPGFSSEKVYGFLAEVDTAKLTRHAGIDDEDIQCYAVSLKLLTTLLQQNKIQNGISLTLLEWLMLHLLNK